MASPLAILASSPNPEVYFNIIALNARAGVKKFVIAAIGLPGGESSAIRVNLEQRFGALVNGLMRGKYIGTSRTEAGKEQTLEDPSTMSSFFTDVDWGSLDFEFRTVDEGDLKEFLSDMQRDNAVFDVTACKNAVIAGTVAWLVSRGVSAIRSLEIKKEMSHGASDLLPYLNRRDFEYVDLSASKLVQGATRRVKIGTISKLTFFIAAGVITLIVVLIAIAVPPAASTPIFAGAATLATILSAAGIFARPSD